MAISGERPPQAPGVEPVAIDGLAYDSKKQGGDSPELVAKAVSDAIFARWPTGCDVLHVHNPILAKNRAFLGILKSLQDWGHPLLLQIHDFAEDGRPGAYFSEAYPANCHYAVINSRDYDILLQSGLKRKGLHLIENTVTPLDIFEEPIGDTHPVLYPVRAIRRKNIGEAILVSLFFSENRPLAITLPPNSPEDFPAYEGWQAYVKQHRLPVRFEAGVGKSFPDLVRNAALILTTSVTEGFGFSFLEPWTAGKLLWGRRLGPICRDFEKNGLCLDHLYDTIDIPLDWIDSGEFLKKWQAAVADACARFQYPIDAGVIAGAVSQMRQRGVIDFGLLNEAYQKQVLDRLILVKGARQELIGVNRALSFPGRLADHHWRIEANRNVVLNRYDQRSYQETLMGVYRKVMDSASHSICKKNLLDHFLDLDRFSLLKWSDHDR